MNAKEKARFEDTKKLVTNPNCHYQYLEHKELDKIKISHHFDDRDRIEQRKKDILGDGCAPLILSKEWYVLDGHCRLQACKELGRGTLAVITPYDKDWADSSELQNWLLWC